MARNENFYNDDHCAGRIFEPVDGDDDDDEGFMAVEELQIEFAVCVR